MMNFYYDTILGLQYTNLGENVLLDIAQIPQNLNIEEFLEKWKKSYNLYLDTGINLYPSIEVVGQITNYMI